MERKRVSHTTPRSLALVAITLSFVTLTVIPFGNAAAQGREPFSTVGISISISQDFASSDFQRSWDTTPAIDVSAAMPFYFGEIRASVRAIHAHSSELTDINSAFVNVGWGGSMQVAGPVRAQASLAAGSMYMSFVDEPVSFRRSESELAVGVRAGLSAAVHSNMQVLLWTEWQHAFTSTPVDFVLAGVGFQYDFPAPGWLRRFLN